MKLMDLIQETGAFLSKNSFMGGDLFYQKHFNDRQGQREFPQAFIDKVLNMVATTPALKQQLLDLDDGAEFILQDPNKFGIKMIKTERPPDGSGDIFWTLVTIHNTLWPKPRDRIIKIPAVILPRSTRRQINPSASSRRV